MEGLAPPLKLAMCVRWALESGETPFVGVQSFLKTSKDSFANEVSRWQIERQWGGARSKAWGNTSPYRQTLLELLEKAMEGKAIYSQLCELEEEILDASRQELNQAVEMLPLKMLVPMMVFQVPAFLFLLFGPLLERFVGGMAQ